MGSNIKQFRRRREGFSDSDDDYLGYRALLAHVCALVCDLVNAEVEARHDESKLLREAKDITDQHIDSLNENYGWSIQINGLERSVSTLYLDRAGIYVAIPRFTLRLPKDIKKLSAFIDTLFSFCSVISDLEQQALSVRQNYALIDLPESSDSKSAFRSSPPRSYCHQQRPTYYWK
ncbi:hypothetical protein EDC94DRAFT_655378 [Helicostylum pulchrum]|nr:hypothetical protein EDC94DRAFT_655378 [Helicostylum pulchrum]